MWSLLVAKPVSLLAVVFLFSSLSFLWSRSRSFPLALFASFVVFAALAGRIEGVALIFTLLTVVCGYGFFQARVKKRVHVLFGTAFFLLAFSLTTHALPDYHNWRIAAGVQLSPGALPYSLYFNFDKPIVGFVILLWGTSLCQSRADWRKVPKTLAWSVPLAVGACIAGAFALGYVKWDPKLPAMTLYWMLDNLFLTCIAEEALFRGLLQKKLTEHWGNQSAGAAIGLIVSSVAFGLVHLWAGWKYALLATLAGFFYGLAFWKSRRIEAAILTHFAVNLIHFLFFTYPALR